MIKHDDMKIVRSSTLRANLQEIVDTVHYTGEPVLVARHSKPWVLITQLSDNDPTLQDFIESHTDNDTGRIKKSSMPAKKKKK